MASGTQSHGKMLDYEQFIDHQLSRTRAKIKTTDILTASLTLATAALAVLFVEVVLDHAFGLPIWIRRIVLFLGMGGGAAFTGLRVLKPLLGRVNGFYAAKTIEGADPAFKNSLISYLDLRKHRDELPRRTLRAIEAKAVGDLTRIEIDSVVNQRRVLHTWYALMGVIVVVFIYYALAPKSLFESAKRAFLSDVVRPTNTRLDSIKPGDDVELSEVVAGSNVPFSVETKGVRPAKVSLRYSIDGGNFFLAQEFAAGPNLSDPWQTTLRNVQQGIDYYVTGGDAESRRYRVRVLPAPMVTGVSLDYKFPAYTGTPHREKVDGGAIDAIEGTDVFVHARTNQPARSGYLDFGKQAQTRMDVNPEDPRELSGKIHVASDGSYTIKFQTLSGQMNPDPVVYDIHATKDAPPSVRFVTPGPRIKLPSNGKVALGIEAGDDYGVESLNLSVALSVAQRSEPLFSKDLLENKTPPRKFVATEVLDLAGMKLKPGTQVEYWLVARDTKDPSSNSARTEKQIIEIGEPLPPDALALAEDKLRKDNPPPPPEDQPKGTQDKAQPVADNHQPRKDGQPGNPPDEARPDRQVAFNDPKEENRPPAEPQSEKPMTPDQIKRLDDLAQRFKRAQLDPPSQPTNPANQDQQPPPGKGPNPDQPPGQAPQPNPRNGQQNGARSADVSPAPGHSAAPAAPPGQFAAPGPPPRQPELDAARRRQSELRPPAASFAGQFEPTGAASEPIDQPEKRGTVETRTPSTRITQSECSANRGSQRRGESARSAFAEQPPDRRCPEQAREAQRNQPTH